jgi:hypothetical protein
MSKKIPKPIPAAQTSVLPKKKARRSLGVQVYKVLEGEFTLNGIALDDVGELLQPLGRMCSRTNEAKKSVLKEAENLEGQLIEIHTINERAKPVPRVVKTTRFKLERA